MTDKGIGESLISCAAVLMVQDIHRSVAFYHDRLGFDVAEIWGDPPSFAIADTPRASIMLKQSISADASANAAPNNQRIGGLWDVYIWVHDLNPIIEHLSATQTEYSPPEEMPHGCTEIVVTDPDGYLICFGYCP